MTEDMFGSSEAGKRGGDARAKKLSKEKRAEIARLGAMSRWEKAGRAPMKRAICGAEDRPLRIGSASIPAYVLEDETRVLSLRGLQEALGLHKSGSGGAPRLAKMLAKIGVTGDAYNGLAARLESPIRFLLPRGGPPAHGYEATVLADICEAILAARKDGSLPKRLEYLADQCEILVRGFARVGIIALVDEVTGFQEMRSQRALADILEAFVAKELQKWVRTFPMRFYHGIFRLWGLPFDPRKPIIKKPSFVAMLTNGLVYERLAPGVLKELQRLNPVQEHGRRAHKHHQYLTPELGHPKLSGHITAVCALMDVSDNKDQFLANMERALPRYQEMPLYPGAYDEKED